VTRFWHCDTNLDQIEGLATANKIVTQSPNRGRFGGTPEFNFEINEGVVSRFWSS
jgi:hypothetical protein